MTTARDIIQAVAEESGVHRINLLSHSRRWGYVWPRQLMQLLMREHTGLSLHQIARETRREDHTTVMHGCRAARDRMLAVPAYRELHDRVVARLMTTPDLEER